MTAPSSRYIKELKAKINDLKVKEALLDTRVMHDIAHGRDMMPNHRKLTEVRVDIYTLQSRIENFKKPNEGLPVVNISSNLFNKQYE